MRQFNPRAMLLFLIYSNSSLKAFPSSKLGRDNIEKAIRCEISFFNLYLRSIGAYQNFHPYSIIDWAKMHLKRGPRGGTGPWGNLDRTEPYMYDPSIITIKLVTYPPTKINVEKPHQKMCLMILTHSLMRLLNLRSILEVIQQIKTMSLRLCGMKIVG